MNRRVLALVVASGAALSVMGCAPRMALAPEPMPAVEYVEVEQAVSEDVYTGGEAGMPSAPGVNAAGIERLIIRNANLGIVVRDTQEALAEIDALADDLEGWIVDSSTYQYQEGLQASVTLRVPADSLDEALARIRDLATEVRSESISGQDVTEEYFDLQASLRHLEATEEKLLEFMEEAEDTEAALAVYEELTQVQSQINQTKGRIEYLEQSAAMATISLDITPDELAQPIEIGGWHPEGTLRDSVQSLIRVLQFLVDAAIVIVVLVLPTLIAIALPCVGLFLGLRALVRRRRARKAGEIE